MWDTRDRSKTYSYPGCRVDEDEHADDYYKAEVIQFEHTATELPPLMIFKQVGVIKSKSAYTLNMNTLKPTKNSAIQTKLTKELRELTMKVYPHLFKTLNPSQPQPAPAK